MGNINTNFQVTATITKRYNYVWKIMGENGIWSEDQNLICRFSQKNLQRDLGKTQIAIYM